MKSRIQKWATVEKLLILLLFLIAFFLRVYRASDLLGFYYDQGRDALEVGNILLLKNLPAIGPTTGIAGLFLGPLWYYFLAPFYFLGNGNPVFAAVGVAFVDSLTVVLLYFFCREFLNKKTGWLSAVIWACSYGLIRNGRWLSHPPLLPFFSVLLLYGLAKWLLKDKASYFLLVLLCLAISLQLEIASAIFFFPAIFFVWLVGPRRLPKKKWLFLGIVVFMLFLLPQIFFELKNNFLMTRNFLGFNRGELNTNSGTWGLGGADFLKNRLNFYFSALFSKLETNVGNGSTITLLGWLTFVGFSIVTAIKKRIFRSNVFLYLVVFLFTPMILLLFFTGNYGNIYDYHLSGVFPVFIILFCLFLSFLLEKKYLWLIFIVFAIWFFNGNFIFIKNYLSAGVDGPTHITLGNELQAIDWIYANAGTCELNVDVYVPPVIPYAYEYLLEWRGQKYGCKPLAQLTPLLYTLYEVDPPHPERLQAWLNRQEGIGRILETKSFGGVTVQRRIRK